MIRAATNEERARARRTTETPAAPYQRAMWAGCWKDGYADCLHGFSPYPPIAPGFAKAYEKGYAAAAKKLVSFFVDTAEAQ